MELLILLACNIFFFSIKLWDLAGALGEPTVKPPQAIEFSHESMSLHDIDWCENSSMLTVQACQQHRVVAMNPSKAKLFPTASMPAVAKLGHRRRGKRGTRSDEMRNARRTHTSKQQCR